MFTEALPLHLQRAQQTKGLIGSRLFSELVPLTVTWKKVVRPGAFADRPAPADLAPIAEGARWGSGWDHAWFRFTGELPASWKNRESIAWIDLGTEGLVFDARGRVTQGISPGNIFDNVFWKGTRPVVELSALHSSTERAVDFWVQASVMSHPGFPLFDQPVHAPLPTVGHPDGRVNHAKLALFDRAAWDLYMDYEVLLDLLEALPAASVRRAKLLRHLTLASEVFARSPSDLTAVRAALRPAFDRPANASDLRAYAVGHGHLDTAWLWPVSTGRQKCARTTANQLLLMDQYPEHVFGFSAALHYEWLLEDHPDLFERVKQRVAEGRWEIQGAAWVEADGNMPSGESLVRQFLYGARFFRHHFGQVSDFLWLPDVFGYPASLPQIMRHCGADTLVTQKISWGQFNKFPHNGFRWAGIDGTEVLAYFPPENNYSSNLLPRGLVTAQERCAERDRMDETLSIFGYGDGGGGPHPKHLERALRCRDLEGCPPVTVAPAGRFIEKLRAHRADLDLWEGAFYLELHRGTLTTQAFVKWANRRLEEQLQATEILWSAAPAAAWPAAELEAQWKMVLRNQFHDIIPGTSIREVYDTTEREYRDGLAVLAGLARRFAAERLAPAAGALTFFNSLPQRWSDVVRLPAALPPGAVLRDHAGHAVPVQTDAAGSLAVIDVPALGFATYRVEPPAPVAAPASASASAEPLVLENVLVRYEFDADARLVRAFDKQQRRELLAPGEAGNVFSLYNDLACQWEAWDIDIYYERERITAAVAAEPLVAEHGPVRSTLRARLRIGDSEIRQTIALRPGARRLDFETEIDWREERKMLRVSFPLALRAPTAAHEIPFGHVMHPTHRNTSREMAMFEHAAHRFVDITETDYGVALLNDGKYGHKVHGSIIDLALLRAPVFPDPQADRGHHAFRYALLPHANPLAAGEVLAEAARFNRSPLVFADAAVPPSVPALPVVVLDGEVSLEALKRAEDGAGWIIRLVERRGRHARERLRFSAPVTVMETDGLEFAEGERTTVAAELEVALRPFQIRTWRIVSLQPSRAADWATQR